jgi:(p)ppGpp synthase/HD superfamily hydrolase
LKLSKRFDEALLYASRTHARQQRKGTRIPYLAHLLGAANLALSFGANEDEAIAALLHDTIEDQGGAAARREIRRRFGARVAAIVDGCSDTDAAPKPPWRARKEQLVARLGRAPRAVRLVCAADKLDNARALIAEYRAHGEAIWRKFNGGREGTLWYYRAVADALSARERTPLVAELDAAVAEIERLARRAARRSRGTRSRRPRTRRSDRRPPCAPRRSRRRASRAEPWRGSRARPPR